MTTIYFPFPLAESTVTYAISILTELKKRNELATPCELTLEYLDKFKSVNLDVYMEYYANFSGIIKLLVKYASLEESCYYSGQYLSDRVGLLNSLNTSIKKFEKSPKDVRTYLNGLVGDLSSKSSDTTNISLLDLFTKNLNL